MSLRRKAQRWHRQQQETFDPVGDERAFAALTGEQQEDVLMMLAMKFEVIARRLGRESMIGGDGDTFFQIVVRQLTAEEYDELFVEEFSDAMSPDEQPKRENLSDPLSPTQKKHAH